MFWGEAGVKGSIQEHREGRGKKKEKKHLQLLTVEKPKRRIPNLDPGSA